MLAVPQVLLAIWLILLVLAVGLNTVTSVGQRIEINAPWDRTRRRRATRLREALASTSSVLHLLRHPLQERHGLRDEGLEFGVLTYLGVGISVVQRSTTQMSSGDPADPATRYSRLRVVVEHLP
jgi:hypothetical protein